MASLAEIIIGRTCAGCNRPYDAPKKRHRCMDCLRTIAADWRAKHRAAGLFVGRGPSKAKRIKPVCTVEGCGRPRRGKQLYCKGHGQRILRGRSPGAAIIAPPKYDTLEKRFFSNVIRGTGDECWGWSGYLGNAGYAGFSIRHKPVGAHRVSWEIHHGPIPAGLYVCHHCDNPPCTRPEHLFLGTAKDNGDDMRAKGRAVHRAPRGEQHRSAKLNEEQVLYVLASKDPGGVLAARFGVSPQSIEGIRAGRTWKHLSQEVSA